ncbi:hypothetical protein J6590_062540 [Homalodisca vitripennis]|nr:hypothetical protein J6590_062540 [Homalodisca vitripennis]
MNQMTSTLTSVDPLKVWRIRAGYAARMPGIKVFYAFTTRVQHMTTRVVCTSNRMSSTRGGASTERQTTSKEAFAAIFYLTI